MAAKFKKGDVVRQVLPAPIQGTVVKMSIVEDDLGYLVQLPDGGEHWFTEAQIEAVS